MEPMLRRLDRRRYQIQYPSRGFIYKGKADPSQVEQIILNLVIFSFCKNLSRRIHLLAKLEPYWTGAEFYLNAAL
jgi:hypothetical protein